MGTEAPNSGAVVVNKDSTNQTAPPAKLDAGDLFVLKSRGNPVQIHVSKSQTSVKMTTRYYVAYDCRIMVALWLPSDHINSGTSAS